MGKVVESSATTPARRKTSPLDPAYGNELLETKQEGKIFTFYIRKTQGQGRAASIDIEKKVIKMAEARR